MSLAPVVIFASLLVAGIAGAEPVLRYTPPAGFTHGAVAPPDDYASNEVAAGVQVYPFRPFSGELEAQFGRTLLREWIDPRFREENVAAPPTLVRDRMPGADAVLIARFVETRAGVPRPRWRAVVVSGTAAAIVDVSAATQESWDRARPAIFTMLTTLRVENVAAPPPVAGGSGRAIAGLYMGWKGKYVVDLNRGVGHGSTKLAPHFYLFSADGRVYRAYDNLEPAHFDFDAAARADPDNSGRYAVQGEQLLIELGASERIVAPLPRGGRVKINDVLYTRQ